MKGEKAPSSIAHSIRSVTLTGHDFDPKSGCKFSPKHTILKHTVVHPCPHKTHVFIMGAFPKQFNLQ